MGGNECCSDTNKCGEQEGDCDSDVDCIDGLICGEDNCILNNDLWWDPFDDCCEIPRSIHYTLYNLHSIKLIFLSYFEFSNYKLSLLEFSEICSGNYYENPSVVGNNKPRPPAGTRCAEPCVYEKGRWGSSYCYTEDGNWGAECIPCPGRNIYHFRWKLYKYMVKYIKLQNLNGVVF